MLFDTAREDRFPEVFRFVLIFPRQFTGSEKNRSKDRPLQVQEEAKRLPERGIGHLGGYRRKLRRIRNFSLLKGVRGPL